jgi:hypothetical protein
MQNLGLRAFHIRDLKFSRCKRETSEKSIRKNRENNMAKDGMLGRPTEKRLEKK